MRKTVVGLLAFAILTASAVYFGSSAFALKQIADAAAVGDVETIVARTNFARLRKSLANQAVVAYGRRNKKPSIGSIKVVPGIVFNAEGAAADAVMARLITPETITELLKSGRLGSPETSGAVQLPSIRDVKIRTALARIRLVNPVTVGFTIGDDGVEPLMHFESSRWKLAGLKIPDALADQLAERLAERRK